MACPGTASSTCPPTPSTSPATWPRDAIATDIVLLGTGSADGWPNPFCRCRSCAAARAEGVLRRPTSALIDGRILLDAGPHVGDAAQRAGVDLAGVEAVLVTHVHNDHLDPAHLLYRSWVSASPLTLVGPTPVIDACRPWLAPESPVRLIEIGAGERITINGYDVRALPADHHAFGACVLFDVRSPDGVRLLYATDTGTDLAEAIALLSEDRARFDLVLVEETFGDRPAERGHLDFDGFGVVLTRLRAAGCIDEATEVVAVHLSHHNPPPAQLQARLSAYRARALPDLARMTITAAD